MLVCQLMVWLLGAVRRFDTVALHAWQSARESISSLRLFRTEADVAD